MRLLLFVLLFSISPSFGQIPQKVENLVGVWNYKTGAGLEIWTKVGGELKGEEIRVNKLGDSIVVEKMSIRFVNEQLIYMIEEHESKVDSLIHYDAKHFVSKNKKMNFINIDSGIPASITYRFGFFNKKKVKIKIEFSRNDKPVKLLMFRKNKS